MLWAQLSSFIMSESIVYIYMVKILTLIGLKDLALVQEYNCNCLTSGSSTHSHQVSYSHFILHVTRSVVYLPGIEFCIRYYDVILMSCIFLVCAHVQ